MSLSRYVIKFTMINLQFFINKHFWIWQDLANLNDKSQLFIFAAILLGFDSVYADWIEFVLV